MATITLRQVKTAEIDDTFTLTATVISSTGGIPVELFTYTNADVFERISTIADLIDWGTTTPTTDTYYRSATVTLNFDNPVEAEENAGYQVTILNTLVADYNLGASAFTGTTDTVITGV